MRQNKHHRFQHPGSSVVSRREDLTRSLVIPSLCPVLCDLTAAEEFSLGGELSEADGSETSAPVGAVFNPSLTFQSILVQSSLKCSDE